jgi:hypothetical protein
MHVYIDSTKMRTKFIPTENIYRGRTCQNHAENHAKKQILAQLAGPAFNRQLCASPTKILTSLYDPFRTDEAQLGAPITMTVVKRSIHTTIHPQLTTGYDAWSFESTSPCSRKKNCYDRHRMESLWEPSEGVSAKQVF